MDDDRSLTGTASAARCFSFIVSPTTEHHVSRFTVMCLALATACLIPGDAARAQQQDSLDAKSAALVYREYFIDLNAVHEKLMSLAGSIPADKYSWRPSADVRSVSEVLMHVAGEWYYVCPISIGGKAPPDFTPPRDAMAKLEKTTSKSDVLEQLGKSWAHCKSIFDVADPAQLTGKYEPAKMSLARAALRVAGDQHEHLGQLIAYARSVGVKPEWSK
jgi:hypothetical protein